MNKPHKGPHPTDYKKKGRPEKFLGLFEFCQKYLPKDLPYNWHHELNYDILENKVIQKEDGKLYLNDEGKINQNILALEPRFHAKSQDFTIDYPIWEIYKNPNVRIIIVSANEDIAVSFNRAIINNLENNEPLIKKWGYLVPQYPKKWGEKALLVQRTSLEKDPTVAAIGVGGKLISRRADIIICDDIIDLETARTKLARSKTKEWFENVLLPILEDTGRLIVVGTAWYKQDIYDYLWKESKFDIRLKLKALMYHGAYRDKRQMRYIPYDLHKFPQALNSQDIFSEKVSHKYGLYMKLQGGVMWEEKWSYEKLMKKKENMTSAAFMRQYLNEPSSEAEKIFKERDTEEAVRKGAHKTLVSSWDNANPKYDYGHLIIAIGVDLAISKARRSDNSALAVWGLTENRNRVLLSLEYGKWSPDETKMRIIQAYDNFHPAKIKVENIAFQEMLRQDLANDDIPVEGFTTTSSRKFNEETGLGGIAMLFEQRKVILPSRKDDAESFNKVKQLLYDMSVYSYDQHAGDSLMASWFALEALRDFDKKLRDNRGYFSTSALVEQLKRVRAANKIGLIGYNPPLYRFYNNSLIYVFREVKHPEIFKDEPFFEPEEPFMIFVNREEKSVAYIYQKQSSEIVGKIEGDLTALMFCNLLEMTGKFFNNAQIIINRVNEGDAIFMELQKRFYPKLLCVQPDEERGYTKVGDGIRITPANLPLAIDYFKQVVDSMALDIRDMQLVKEMGELIGVSNDKLTMSFGTGIRIKTAAFGLWLLDNYENREKKLLKNPPKKKSKKLNVPYRVFNYK